MALLQAEGSNSDGADLPKGHADTQQGVPTAGGFRRGIRGLRGARHLVTPKLRLAWVEGDLGRDCAKPGGEGQATQGHRGALQGCWGGLGGARGLC